MSNSLQHHRLQPSRIPCPSLSSTVCSNSWSVSQWCHPTRSLWRVDHYTSVYISEPRSLVCKDVDGSWLLDLRIFIFIHVSPSWCWMELGMKEKRFSPLVLVLWSLKIWEGSLFPKDRVSPADIPCSIIWGLVAQSCLILCNPWSVACQAPLLMEFSRQEYWSG